MSLIKQNCYSANELVFSRIFTVFSHAARIRILSLLLVEHTKTLGQLHEFFPELAQSTVSEHIKKLKQIGLIKGCQVNSSVYYGIAFEAWEEVKAAISLFIDDEKLKQLHPNFSLE